jgi:HEAT repeat protein
LGLDVESDDPPDQGSADPTQPAEFPRALYFTQCAGPRFAHRVLQRAVSDADSPVALGAIEALRVTAGESSLIGLEDGKQPLVQALRFPDWFVRVRAALALGAALPKSQFADSQFVVPVLAQALGQTGKEQVIVVEPDEANLNRVVGALRAGGRDAIGSKGFYQALEQARVASAATSGLFVASDVSDPELSAALRGFRAEFTFSKVPVVILSRPGQSVLANEAARGLAGVEIIDAAADGAGLLEAFARGRDWAGLSSLDDSLTASIALQAAETLRRIALDGRTVFDFGAAEPALIGALSATQEELQITAASVLALAPKPTAQRAIAHVALSPGGSSQLRLAAFDSLAESAKNHGHLLEERQVDELIRIAKTEPDLVMRTAAAKALGSLNLLTDRAGEIIRGFHGG